MTSQNLIRTSVFMACLLIAACSDVGSDELSRDSAAILIAKNLNLPETVSAKLKKAYVKETKIVQRYTPGRCQHKNYPDAEKNLLLMVANGVIELSERQVIQNKCAHTFVDVKLTQQGRQFQLSENNKEYTVRTAEVVFDQVTGIRSSADDTTAIVEYELKTDNRTPFFVTEPRISKRGSKNFAKYDDGWRIFKGSSQGNSKLMESGVEANHIAAAVVSKVTQGLNLAGAGKLAVKETFESEGNYPSVGNNPDANAAYGLPSPTSIVGNYTSGLAILDSGVIRITYNENLGGDPSANGHTILVAPKISNNKIVEWDCSGGTMPETYRPPECR